MNGNTTVAHDATGGVGGTGAIVFGDGGYAFRIKRPVYATVGTDYMLSVDIKTVGWDTPGTYDIAIVVEGLEVADNSVSINGLADYTTIELSGTATNDSGYIMIEGGNTLLANNVWIDNLEFDDDFNEVDVIPPTLLTAAAITSSLVELVFDDDIDPVTGANVANYSLDHAIGAPTSAVVLEDVVTLTLGTGLMFDSTYTVIVNNVADESGNVLLADTASFMYTYEFVNDLFFSEYIDGSSSNKALEIYNPTDAAIDLAGYFISGTGNEATDWETYYNFPDTASTIAAQSTYVIVDGSAVQELKDVANWVQSYPSPTSYNGNDARGLMKRVGLDSILIDVIGDPVNPTGEMYTVAGIADALDNHTVLRKAPVMMGNPDWTTSSGADAETSEWVVFGVDEFRFLGAHPHADLVGPELADITAVSETQLQLRFNEPVVSADALVLANYSVSGEIGNPTAVTMLSESIYLLDIAAIAPNMTYSLTVNGIHDISGNEMTAGSTIDVVLDIPGTLPIDNVIFDFVNGTGNFWQPTGSGSTYGVLDASSFASTDTMSYSGTHSGALDILDDPADAGGWFVRMYDGNGGFPDRIQADSKLFFYLRGGNADMQVRLVVRDDDGYEVGDWHDVTYAEADWQVISLDLLNDQVTGWVNGNGSINSVGGDVGISGIHIRCSEDISTTLFIDMITERYNIAPVEVTFDVNMSVQALMETFDLSSDFVDVAGNFNGQGTTPMVLADPEADSLYTITLTDLYPGEALEYKFRINGSDATAEFPDGPARVYVVPDSNSTVFHWYNDVDVYVGIAGLLIPTEFALHDNYPNPFNPITNIKYDIPENTFVRLSIYNTLGQHVVDLVNEHQAPGFYHLQWNGLNKKGTPVSSGMFIYRLTTTEFTKSEKMTYLK